MFCVISWVIDLQGLYPDCLKLFVISHCKLKVIYIYIYIEKVNQSSLQSAQEKDQSNILIQNLFNQCLKNCKLLLHLSLN